MTDIKPNAAGFKAFVDSRAKDEVIQHIENGSPSANGCAIGLYWASLNGMPYDRHSGVGYGRTPGIAVGAEPNMFDRYKEVPELMPLYVRLEDVRLAVEHFPTYDHLQSCMAMMTGA